MFSKKMLCSIKNLKILWINDRRFYLFQCAAPCDAQGVKYRILQCVWYGTKKPAGNACRDQPRPSVMKVCKGPPCSDSKSSDNSYMIHTL